MNEKDHTLFAIMGAFSNDALIERWVDAFRWAWNKPPDQIPKYENGWFVWSNDMFTTIRSRRKDLIAAIIQLENRPKA